MNLHRVSEILESFYYNGVVKSDSKQLDRETMLEYSKLAYANVMVKKWEVYKRVDFGNEYYFYTGALVRKKFPLGETTSQGRRTIDMSATPVVRLPKNMHLFNILPLNKSGCDCGTVTIVQPAEERFYQSADFANFPYASPIGSNIDCYNFPLCIKEVEVEAVFDDVEADIPNDIAADVCIFVLRDILKVKGIDVDKIDDNNPNEIVQRIKEQLPLANPR